MHKQDPIWLGLTLAVLAIFVGGAILLWMDLVSSRDYWLVWVIALPFLAAEAVYLNFYYDRRRKRDQTSPLVTSVSKRPALSFSFYFYATQVATRLAFHAGPSTTNLEDRT